MLGLVKGLFKGFGKKKTKEAEQQKNEVNPKNIKEISGEDIRNRTIPNEKATPVRIFNKQEAEKTSPIQQLKTPNIDFSHLDKKLEKDLDSEEEKDTEVRNTGLASAFKGDKDGVQEQDLKKSIQGLKGFIGTEIDTVKKEIKLISTSSNKELGNKLESIKAVTKDNMEINKDSLEIQKSSFEIAKDAAYAAAHRAKESLKNSAKKVKDKGTALVGAGVGAIKNKVDEQGGWMKSIMKLLAGAYLIKTFWPVIKKHLWPIIKDKLWPFLQDTVWPFIKENFMTILGGMGIMAFLKNPLGFLKTGLNLALKTGGFIFNGITSLMGSVFKVGGTVLKGIGIGLKKTAELAWDGVKDIGTELKKVTSGLAQKAKDLGAKISTKIGKGVGIVKDKVVGGLKAAKDFASAKLLPLKMAIADNVNKIKDKISAKMAPLTKTVGKLTDKVGELGRKGITKAKKLSGKIAGIFSGEGNGKMGKVAKGLGSAFKVMKGLAKVVPFLGIIITVWDLLDTFFPNFTKSISKMFSLDKIKALGGEIWDKVKAGVTGIASWISDKMAGMINTVRGLVANLVASTYGKMPVIGKYANNLADFIRGESDGTVAKDYESSEKQEQRVQTMEKGGYFIDTNGRNEVDEDKLKEGLKTGKVTSKDLSAMKNEGNLDPKNEKILLKLIEKTRERDNLAIIKKQKQAEIDATPEGKAKLERDAKQKELDNLIEKQKQEKKEAQNRVDSMQKTIDQFNNIIIPQREKIIEKLRKEGKDTSQLEKGLIQFNKTVKDVTNKKELAQKVIDAEPKTLDEVKGIKQNKIMETSYQMNSKDGKVNISKEQNERLNAMYNEFSLAMDSGDNKKLDELNEKQDLLRAEILEEVKALNEKAKPSIAKDLNSKEVKSTTQNLGLTEYKNGGWTGTGKDDEIAGVVHKNEYVLSQDQLKELDAALTEGEKSNAIKRISDGKGEEVESNLKELMERRQQDSKASNKSYKTTSGGVTKEVNNVTVGQARELDNIQNEQQNTIDFDKMDALDKKMDALMDSINNGTYENKDNKVKYSTKPKEKLATSTKEDEKATSPEIVKNSSNIINPKINEERLNEVVSQNEERVKEDSIKAKELKVKNEKIIKESVIKTEKIKEDLDSNIKAKEEKIKKIKEDSNSKDEEKNKKIESLEKQLKEQKEKAEIELAKAKSEAKEETKNNEKEFERETKTIEQERRKEDNKKKKTYKTEDEKTKVANQPSISTKAVEVPKKTQAKIESEKDSGKSFSLSDNSQSISLKNVTNAQSDFLESLKEKEDKLREQQRIISEKDPFAFDSKEYTDLEKEIEKAGEAQMTAMKEMKEKTWKDTKVYKNNVSVANVIKKDGVSKNNAASRQNNKMTGVSEFSNTNIGNTTKTKDDDFLTTSSNGNSSSLAKKEKSQNLVRQTSSVGSYSKALPANNTSFATAPRKDVSSSTKLLKVQKQSKSEEIDLLKGNDVGVADTKAGPGIKTDKKSQDKPKKKGGPSAGRFKKPNRPCNKTFIHCSDSDYPQHDNVETIREWHTLPKPRGRGWSDIGYHYMIHKDGKVSKGRPIEKTPAQAAGNNTGSIGIVVHGKKNAKFTGAQMTALKKFCTDIDEAYEGNMTFHGHREVSSKSCPVFDYMSVLKLDANGKLGIKSAGGVEIGKAGGNDVSSSDAKAGKAIASSQGTDTQADTDTQTGTIEDEKVKATEVYEEKEFDTSTKAGKKMKAKYDSRFDIVPERKAQYTKQLGELTALGDTADKEQKNRKINLEKKLEYFPDMEERMLKDETNAEDDIFVADLNNDKDGDGNVSTKEHLEAAAEEAKDIASAEMEKALSFFGLEDLAGVLDAGNMADQLRGVKPGREEADTSGVLATIGSKGMSAAGGLGDIIGGVTGGASNMAGNVLGSFGVKGMADGGLSNKIKDGASSIFAKGKSMFAGKTKKEIEKKDSENTESINDTESKEVSSETKTYIVQPGDTMPSIAKEKNMSLVDLSNFNPQVEDIDKVIPGTELNLEKEKVKPLESDESLMTPLSEDAKKLNEDSSTSELDENTKVIGDTISSNNMGNLVTPSIGDITKPAANETKKIVAEFTSSDYEIDSDGKPKVDENGNKILNKEGLEKEEKNKKDDSMKASLSSLGVSSGIMDLLDPKSGIMMDALTGKKGPREDDSGSNAGFLSTIGAKSAAAAGGLGNIIGGVTGGAANMVEGAATSIMGAKTVGSIKDKGASLFDAAKGKVTEKGGILDKVKGVGGAALGGLTSMFSSKKKADTSISNDVSNGAKQSETLEDLAPGKEPELLNKNTQTANSLAQTSAVAEAAEMQAQAKAVAANVTVASKRDGKDQSVGAATKKLAAATVEKRAVEAKQAPTVVNNITQGGGGGTPPQLTLQSTDEVSDNMVGLFF